eukprot:TRINITY_DN2831_c0_g1_i2.p1 TRINITY_DN2831_c0_g1~~TRINITY_DN2831_c0_g1_i2.p1  ORF type:complete len:105 (-),score=24.69 TRINITY_DN2831_c0_g1_i2:44-358(-)
MCEWSSSNIYITLKGRFAEQGEYEFQTSDNDFEKGHTDTFYYSTLNAGFLDSIQIRSDNSGPSSGWYLEYVDVSDPVAKLNYRFEYKNWIEKATEIPMSSVEPF